VLISSEVAWVGCRVPVGKSRGWTQQRYPDGTFMILKLNFSS